MFGRWYVDYIYIWIYVLLDFDWPCSWYYFICWLTDTPCLQTNSAHFLPNVTAELRTLRNDLSLSGEDSLNWRDFIALMMDKQLVMKEDNLRMVFEHFKKSDPHYIVYPTLSTWSVVVRSRLLILWIWLIIIVMEGLILMSLEKWWRARTSPSRELW